MDDFEKKIKESKNVISKNQKNLATPNEIYQKARNIKRFDIKKIFAPKMVLKYLIVLLLIGIGFGGGYLISNSTREVNKEPIIIDDTQRDTIKPDPIEHVDNVNSNKSNQQYLTFETSEDLIKYLNTNKSLSTRKGTKGIGAGDELVEEEVANAPSSVETNNDNSQYQTNIQVEGVDEADIVKVIGNKIFYLPTKNYNENGRVCMLEEEKDNLYLRQIIQYGKKEEILKTINGYNLIQASEKEPLDLYVTDKFLIVRVSKSEYKRTQEDATKRDCFSYYDYINTTLFEIYDINTLELVNTIDTAGYNVSTRLINNTLYVINNYNDYLYSTKSFYYSPFFYVDGVYFEADLSRIYYPKEEDYLSKSFISLYKIDLNNGVKIDDLHILSSYANNVYATDANVYLINSYENEVINDTDYQYVYPISVVTVVNIKDNLTLLGTFSVKGNISDKYWIDEKDNFVRVVSSGGQTVIGYIEQKYFYSSKTEIFNYLTIFEYTSDGFVQRSIITEGIGKEGESIKSARFNGDLVTVVTFRQTDPLYYIDISDPNNPIITSAFEISGFSIYQHPYKNNLLIGFGYEADSNGRTTGYKITLFDISDKENIKSVGSSFIINLYSDTDSYNKRHYYTPDFFNNPKALFINLDRGLFGFRIASYTYYNDSKKSIYENEYLVFSINENEADPFEIILHEVASSTEYDITRKSFDRMVFIGKNYYLLSSDHIRSFKYQGGKLIPNEKISLNVVSK